MKDLLEERALLSVYDPQVLLLLSFTLFMFVVYCVSWVVTFDPSATLFATVYLTHRFFFFFLFSFVCTQVTREQMFCEFDYTLGLNEATLPGLDKMITTSASAMDAIQVKKDLISGCFWLFLGV